MVKRSGQFFPSVRKTCVAIAEAWYRPVSKLFVFGCSYHSVCMPFRVTKFAMIDSDGACNSALVNPHKASRTPCEQFMNNFFAMNLRLNSLAVEVRVTIVAPYIDPFFSWDFNRSHTMIALCLLL